MTMDPRDTLAMIRAAHRRYTARATQRAAIVERIAARIDAMHAEPVELDVDLGAEPTVRVRGAMEAML